MKNQKIFSLGAAALVSIFFTACGDETTNEIVERVESNMKVVESSEKMPSCNEENEGELIWVKEEDETQVCVDGYWRSTTGRSVSVGDYSCSTEQLDDKTGIKIVCNGDSIGVVYNGADGENGSDGNDGKDGVNGKDGKDGTDGKNGADGSDGDDGKSGSGCTMQQASADSIKIVCGDSVLVLPYQFVESEETDEDVEAISDMDLGGYSQKGPFVVGSSVTAYELLNGRTLKQTGNTFSGTIQANDGRFNIKSVKLKSQYSYLVVDGYFRNEVTGKNSASPIKLRAVTNLKGRASANVNLLTHLEYERVLYLVTKKGMSVAKAKRQAEIDVFNAFHIDASKFTGYSEDLDAFGTGDQNAALLAASIMLQGDRTESELTSILTSFSYDIADDGDWNDPKTRAEIADWIMKMDTLGMYDSFELYVKNWGLSKDVPPFRPYARNFWNQELGLDTCDAKRAGKIKKFDNTFSTIGETTRFICDDADHLWRKAEAIEKDTFELGYDFDENTMKAGQVNKDYYYILVKDAKTSKKIWREATEFETDTLLIGNELRANKAPFEDAVIRTGRSGAKYVYESKTWRNPNEDEVSLNRACVAFNNYERIATAKDGASDDDDEDQYADLVKNCDDFDEKCEVFEIVCSGLTSDYCVALFKQCVAMNAYCGAENENSVRKDVSSEMDDFTFDMNRGSSYYWICNNGKWNSSNIFEYRFGRCADAERTLYRYCADESNSEDCELKKPYFAACENEQWSVAKEAEYNVDKKICDEPGKIFNGLEISSYKYKCFAKGGDGEADQIVRVSALDSLTKQGLACVQDREGQVDQIKGDFNMYLCRDGLWEYTLQALNSQKVNVVMIDGSEAEFEVVGHDSLLWMAENLNFLPDTTKDEFANLRGLTTCHEFASENDDVTCDKYGRYYSWTAMLNLPPEYSSKIVPLSVKYGQGICPDGWELPSTEMVDGLISKATQGADFRDASWDDGLDVFGLHILPYGYIRYEEEYEKVCYEVGENSEETVVECPETIPEDESELENIIIRSVLKEKYVHSENFDYPIAEFWKNEESGIDNGGSFFVNRESVGNAGASKTYLYNVRCVKRYSDEMFDALSVVKGSVNLEEVDE